jgi:hypothetical protein
MATGQPSDSLALQLPAAYEGILCYAAKEDRERQSRRH